MKVLFRQSIGYLRSKGKGQSKSFSPRNWMVREKRESEECLWLQNTTQLPSRRNLAKIGPAKNRISLTGPRVCPREGDNRPELRLAAATKLTGVVVAIPEAKRGRVITPESKVTG